MLADYLPRKFRLGFWTHWILSRGILRWPDFVTVRASENRGGIGLPDIRKPTRREKDGFSVLSI
jgi:hypothetical protein